MKTRHKPELFAVIPNPQISNINRRESACKKLSGWCKSPVFICEKFIRAGFGVLSKRCLPPAEVFTLQRSNVTVCLLTNKQMYQYHHKDVHSLSHQGFKVEYLNKSPLALKENKNLFYTEKHDKT